MHRACQHAPRSALVSEKRHREGNKSEWGALCSPSALFVHYKSFKRIVILHSLLLILRKVHAVCKVAIAVLFLKPICKHTDITNQNISQI